MKATRGSKHKKVKPRMMKYDISEGPIRNELQCKADRFLEGNGLLQTLYIDEHATRF